MATAPSPSQVAYALTGRPHLSYSAVRTYLACPRRWYFRYVLGWPEPTVPASLVLGAAVHRALARHYRAVMQGQRLPTLRDLLGACRDGWRGYEDREVQYGRQETRATLDHRAARLLAACQASPVARPRGRVVGVEAPLGGELMPQLPPILGRLDLLVDEGDQLAILDFKTARAPWGSQQVAEHGGQLHLYHELLWPLTPGKPIRLAFVVLTKTRIPKVIGHDVSADGRAIGQTRQTVARVWDAMQSGVVHPKPSRRHCPTCPFRQACDARSE